MNIDILGTPPTPEEIAAKRVKVRNRLKKSKIIGWLVGILCFMEFINTLRQNMLLHAAVFLAIVFCFFVAFKCYLIVNTGGLAVLQDASQESCIDIHRYQFLKEIEEYQEKVLSMKRQFIVAEVEAMKEYFDGRDARQAYMKVYRLSESNHRHSE